MKQSHLDSNPAAQDASPNIAARTPVGDIVDSSAREAAYDSALVQRTRKGDDSAFVEIIDRYQGKIFNVAHRFLRNTSDAEEVAQDTFIRAHRNLANFRGDASLGGWLYRIAMNLSCSRYSYFFRRGRHNSLSLDRPIGFESNSTLGDFIATQDQGPADEAVTSEFSDLITRCIETLDAPHREVLVMRSVLDLPYGEIAQTLGLDIGTVKSRIGRARENLRQAIIQAAPDFGPESRPRDFLPLSRNAYN